MLIGPFRHGIAPKTCFVPAFAPVFRPLSEAGTQSLDSYVPEAVRNCRNGMIMNQKFIVRFCLAAALLCGPVFASAYAAPAKADSDQNTSGQTITVRGTVYDDQGAPLPGAGVMVKGTTQGTITDLDGNYEIRVKPNQTLVISFVGMKDQEIPVNGRTQLNAALDSQATTLDDVVVVGYGAIKKANLTGAVDVVDSKAFENRVAANVDQMLLGNIPSVGIAITDGAPYRRSYGYQIRTSLTGSLNASSAAGDYEGVLVLIDGMEGDPTLINPNDIESISVLKDAAASAIYGGRGAMGVILITTKNAKAGDKVKVTYSANFNVGTPTALPELLTDGAKYLQIKADFYEGFNGTQTKISNLWPDSTLPLTIKAGYEDAEKQAALVGGVYTTNKGKYEYYGNTDWFKQIYKQYAPSQIHNLSVAGTSDTGKTTYLVSGRFYDYKGLYVGKSDPYTTWNLRSKIGIQVFPWLKLEENIEYTHDNVSMGLASSGTGLSTPQMQLKSYGAPTWPVFNPDGTFTKAGAYILGGLIGDSNDPDAPYRRNKNKLTKVFRTTTAATASFFNDTFRIKADLSYRDKNIDVIQKYAGIYYSTGVNADGSPTLLNQVTKDFYKQRAMEQFKNWNWLTTNEYAEYENTFGRHWLKLMAGFNYEKRNLREGQYRINGLDFDGALGENPFAFATGEVPGTDVTGYLDLDGSNMPIKHWRTMGTFFRVNYSYDDRYLIEVNGRYDGSSIFVNEYQWGFFPSVSAAWRPTQEHWWHIDPKFISALKFRASYGELGDCMSAGAYNTEDNYSVEYDTSRVINGSSSTRYLENNNPGAINWMYTWSRVRTKDVGVDAAFFNNKFDVTFDYYWRDNLNMITEGPEHAATFGADAPFGNYADMTTSGWELTFHFNDQFLLGGHPFHFGAHGSIGDSKAVVTRFQGNDNLNIKPFNYREGEVIGEVWGFKSNGLFQSQEQIDNAFGQGKPYNQNVGYTSKKSYVAKPGDIWLLDLDGDDKVTNSDFLNKETGYAGDKTIIGNKRPRYPFSFGFDFDYVGFFFSVGFQGILHQDYFINGGSLALSSYDANNGPVTKWFVDKYWTEDNTDALFPRAAKGNQLIIGNQTQWNDKFSKYPIDRYMFDIGYINLQNLQFGYNLPRKLIQKISLSDAKIFFSGENLWNWSPFYKTFGRDYDVTTIAKGGDDYEYGMDWWGSLGGYQYPKLRTFSLGLSVTFDGGSGSALKNAGNGNAELVAALAAANAAADAAKAAADKAQADADALKAELANALKAKEDCENAPKPMAVRRAEALYLEDIYFEINQSVIRDSEAYKVDNLVKVLKDNPEAKISITGYADQGTGTSERNLVLTKERAEVVAAALKAAGIAPDRIHTEFYGTEKDSSWTPENNRLAVCIVNN